MVPGTKQEDKRKVGVMGNIKHSDLKVNVPERRELDGYLCW